MSSTNTKQQGKLLFIFGPEQRAITSEKYEPAQNDISYEDEELMDDDENDINGDDAENTNICKTRIFYMTHRESPSDIDPAYK
ncbi:MAG: hypothetical protein QM737_06495 [Ferruginibacter sp.]